MEKQRFDNIDLAAANEGLKDENSSLKKENRYLKEQIALVKPKMSQPEMNSYQFCASTSMMRSTSVSELYSKLSVPPSARNWRTAGEAVIMKSDEKCSDWIATHDGILVALFRPKYQLRHLVMSGEKALTVKIPYCPTYLGISPSGKLVGVSCVNNKCIYLLDSRLRLISSNIGKGDLKYPCGISFTSDSKIVVRDTHAKKIYIFGNRSGRGKSYEKLASFPYDHQGGGLLKINSMDQVIIDNPNVLEKYDLDGSLIGRSGGQDTSMIVGFCIDGENRIIACFDQQVMIIDANLNFEREILTQNIPPYCSELFRVDCTDKYVVVGAGRIDELSALHFQPDLDSLFYSKLGMSHLVSM